MLRAKITLSKGHYKKAAAHFNDAVKASPLNRGAWIEYMHYALSHNKKLILGIFQSAMEHDPDMFSEDYLLYLLGTQELDLFSDSNYLIYYEKFADFFICQLWKTAGSLKMNPGKVLNIYVKPLKLKNLVWTRGYTMYLLI